MTPLAWRMVDIASRVLERRERDIVLGDFEELGTPGGHALREVLGLAIRRQAVLWKTWGPWLALVGVVLPLGALLSLVSRRWADVSAIHAVVWLHNGDWSYLSYPGWRHDVVRVGAETFVAYLALMGWSWSCGFMIGSVSRRATWLNAILFGAVLFGATVGSTSGPRAGAGNAMVFSMLFYRTVFPVLLRIGLVLLPALWGMRQSRQRKAFSLGRAFLFATAIATLTALQSGILQSSVAYYARHLVDPRSPLRLFYPLLMMWPAAYIVATARWQRRSEGRPSRRFTWRLS